MSSENVVNTLCDVINQIKKTAFSADIVDLDFYLGGDLGIDSREMLEIWYDLEQKFDIKIHDSEKRDLYQISDVVRLLESKLEVMTV